MDRQEEYSEFEQMLEKHGATEAIIRYYKSHARTILIGIMSVCFIVAMTYSSFSVGERLATLATIIGANYAYGRIKNAN